MSRSHTARTDVYPDTVTTTDVTESTALPSDGDQNSSQPQQTTGKDDAGWPGSHGLRMITSSMSEWKHLPIAVTGGVTHSEGFIHKRLVCQKAKIRKQPTIIVDKTKPGDIHQNSITAGTCLSCRVADRDADCSVGRIMIKPGGVLDHRNQFRRGTPATAMNRHANPRTPPRTPTSKELPVPPSATGLTATTDPSDTTAPSSANPGGPTSTTPQPRLIPSPAPSLPFIAGGAQGDPSTIQTVDADSLDDVDSPRQSLITSTTQDPSRLASSTNTSVEAQSSTPKQDRVGESPATLKQNQPELEFSKSRSLPHSQPASQSGSGAASQPPIPQLSALTQAHTDSPSIPKPPAQSPSQAMPQVRTHLWTQSQEPPSLFVPAIKKRGPTGIPLDSDPLSPVNKRVKLAQSTQAMSDTIRVLVPGLASAALPESVAQPSATSSESKDAESCDLPGATTTGVATSGVDAAHDLVIAMVDSAASPSLSPFRGILDGTKSSSVKRQAENIQTLLGSLVDHAREDETKALETRRKLSKLETTVRTSVLQIDRLKSKTRSLEDERTSLIERLDQANQKEVEMEQKDKELVQAREALERWRTRAKEFVGIGDERESQSGRKMDDYELWEAVQDQIAVLVSRQIQADGLTMEQTTESEGEP